MGTKLTLEIIESFKLPKKQYKPDYDDMGYEFTLPNGIVLSCLFVCNGSPCKSDSLEGLDGWIYIETKEELLQLYELSYGEVINIIVEENDEFHLNDYID